MKIRSLALKLALLVGTLGLLQSLAVLGFSYSTMSANLAQQKRDLLKGNVVEARHLLDKETNLAALSSAAYRLSDLLSGHEGLHVAVARPGSSTALVAFSPIGVESVRRLHTDTWGADAFLDWRMPQSDAPMLSIVVSSEVVSGEGYVLLLTSDRSNDEELLSKLLFTALTAAPFALVIVSLGAWTIVSIGLRPLSRFRAAAMRVTAKNMSGRISPDEMPQELLTLCLAFNAMLDRLDDGIRRLSQFSGDLAHEMRTPISILLGRTQVALSQSRTHGELIELLEGNVDELERLGRVVADMLFLARADNTTEVLNSTTVELGDEAIKSAEYVELLAHERDISFHVSGHGKILADRTLVGRAITNLLSNAARYGEANSSVEIRIKDENETVDLTVMNKGERISFEHRERLFDRFYRTDSARSRDSGGTGLGLSIVRAIMTLHGGHVTMESDEAGITSFTLHFPKSSKNIEGGLSKSAHSGSVKA
ncbi:MULTISPECIES: heavy metal sensor histidine kinase [Massilia]|uniref:heavy metal sensor histidine kinase n=1 Tax=Massilia TaxID=149698 RepID=UPI000950C9D2|nr:MULTISPECIES: heavy metal sensor histidine kinase [Massilia]